MIFHICGGLTIKIKKYVEDKSAYIRIYIKEKFYYRMYTIKKSDDLHPFGKIFFNEDRWKERWYTKDRDWVFELNAEDLQLIREYDPR